MKLYLNTVLFLCILVLNKGYAQTPGTQNFMFYSVAVAVYLPIFGASSADHSGYSVSAAGDVNNDGIDDVIVGAYGASPDWSTRRSAGISYMVFGRLGSR